ncbi:MAG: hypothetical protein ACK559_05125, partial [bacterium]
LQLDAGLTVAQKGREGALRQQREGGLPLVRRTAAHHHLVAATVRPGEHHAREKRMLEAKQARERELDPIHRQALGPQRGGHPGGQGGQGAGGDGPADDRRQGAKERGQVDRGA